MFKYIPALKPEKYCPKWSRYSIRQRWAEYSSDYELVYRRTRVLIPKEVHEKIKLFTKPIDMRKYLELRKELESQMFAKMSVKTAATIMTDDLRIDVSAEYEEEHDKIKKQWKERMDAAGGQFLMQYNAKVSLFGDNWTRMCQASLNECNGEMEEGYESYKKISWFRYLFVDTTIDLMIQFTCKLNNFWYRKEIAAERAAHKEAEEKWWEDLKINYGVKDEHDTGKN